MNNKPLAVSAVLTLALALLPGAVFAQKKVPGEMWKQTTSMEMMGMSMPSRTSQMCVPVGKANEALSRPDNPNCSVHDVKNAGNTFSAKMVCTGKDAMEGDIETVSDGRTIKGVTHMKMQGGEGTIKFESTRIGTACEAVDYSDYKPPVVNVPKLDPDALCKQQIAEIQKDPSTLANRASLFVGPSASCGKSPAFTTFCSAAQTHRGFLSMAMHEKRMSTLMPAGTKPDATTAPLSATITGCGLGKMPAAADALRTKLVASAEAQSEYEFLIAEGGEPGFNTAAAVAKRECSGRAYTNAANAKYRTLCGRWGALLVRGDRAGIMSMIDGSCSGDCGSGSGPPAAAGTAAPAAATSGPAAGQGTGQQDAAKESTKDKAKDKVEQGKKFLRGILGGG